MIPKPGDRVLFKSGHAWAGETGTVTSFDDQWGWRVSIPTGFAYAQAYELAPLEPPETPE